MPSVRLLSSASRWVLICYLGYLGYGTSEEESQCPTKKIGVALEKRKVSPRRGRAMAFGLNYGGSSIHL
jgi:hypothetical protein